MPEGSKVTLEEANKALQQLVSESEQPESVETKPETIAESAPETTATAESEVAAAEVAPAEEPEAVAASDDVESLKKRLTEAEEAKSGAEKRYEARLRASQQRHAESERILRERYLRKSTATDRALRVLKSARSAAGVEPAEADRVIAELESTMNPASPSYVPPEPHPAATEDQALTLNSFLDEKQMTQEDADEFGRWIRTEAVTVMSPPEQAVATQSLDGFLRLAHNRWQEGLREKAKKATINDAVGAVKAVQRTQREAARAATAPAASPKKQPASPATEVDVKKLTPKDISALLRQSVEQYQ